MTLTLHILSSGAQAGRQNSIIMSGSVLTIGRVDSNDLVLPDPEREISSNHAVIQAQGTDYVVVDTSTNGTFLNGGAEALGDFPAPVNNGDTLRIGRYELRIEIQSASADPFANLPPPLEDAPAPGSGGDIFAEVGSLDTDGGDFLEDLLGEAPPNAMTAAREDFSAAQSGGAEEIDAFLDIAPDPNLQGGASVSNHSPASSDFFTADASASGIPDDWDDDFLSGDEDPFKPPSANPTPVAKAPAASPGASQPLKDDLDDILDPAPSVPVAPPADLDPAPASTPAAPPVQPEPAPPAKVAATPTGQGGGADHARSFLRAAGVRDDQIADDELEEIMTASGTVFRTLIEGAREVLMARASIKDELRLGQTMISPDGNNPIKFSISGQQAVEAMIKPTVPGYKAGPASAQEAMNDIKAHEVAMMSGMENAIKALLGRFDPDTLAKKLEDDGGMRGLLKGKKARYWEVFEKLYSQISEEAEDDFHSLFGKEFGKAYKAQMAKLKSQDDKGK